MNTLFYFDCLEYQELKNIAHYWLWKHYVCNSDGMGWDGILLLRLIQLLTPPAVLVMLVLLLFALENQTGISSDRVRHGVIKKWIEWALTYNCAWNVDWWCRGCFLHSAPSSRSVVKECFCGSILLELRTTHFHTRPVNQSNKRQMKPIAIFAI